MSFFEMFSNKKYMLVVIKEASAIFYKVDGAKLELIVTISLYEKNLQELNNVFAENKDVKVKILLDLNKENYKTVTIPDAGSVNIKVPLREKLSDDLKKYKILHPVLIQKPSDDNPYWRFIVVRLNLNKDITKFIESLFQRFNKINAIYLAPVENMELCRKLKNVCFADEVKSSQNKNNYYAVYLYHYTDYVYETIFKNDAVYSIGSYHISDNDISQAISEIAEDNHDRLSAIDDTSNIKTLLILPNYIKEHIHFKNNVSIISTLEAAKKLEIVNAVEGAIQCSDILLFSNFVVQKPSKLNIQNLKKLNLLQQIYEHSRVPLIALMMALLFLMNRIDLSYKKEAIFKSSLESELKSIDDKYSHELKIHSQSILALDEEKGLRKLYNIIKTNQYSIDTMKLIKLAKNSNIFLENFTYSKTRNVTGNSVIILDVNYPFQDFNKNNKVFKDISEFINNLKENLPDKEISFYRLTEDLQTKNSQENVPIEIKIIEPVEHN